MFANIELCEEKACVFGHPSTVALIPFFLPQRKLVSDCFSNVSFFVPFETKKMHRDPKLMKLNFGSIGLIGWGMSS